MGYEPSTRCLLDRILHPDGTVTEYDYDCEGNLERVWDANHPSEGKTAPPTQRYVYDALNRLTTTSQPWGGPEGGTATTSYAYDVHDHLVEVTDAEGNTTTYVYRGRARTRYWVATAIEVLVALGIVVLFPDLSE